MFEKCITCTKLGDTCGGPNFVMLSAQQLIEWCRQRKQHLRLSNAQLAEMANMSKGTIDGLFAGSHSDYRYETIRSVMHVLASGKSIDCCREMTGKEKADLLARITELEDRACKADEIASERISFAEQELVHVRELAHGRLITIRILAWGLVCILLLVILSFVLDKLDPSHGWFTSLIK